MTKKYNTIGLKLIAILIVLPMIIGNVSYAEESGFSDIVLQKEDTLYRSQNEILRQLNSDMENKSLTKENITSRVCEAYLLLGKASVRDEINYHPEVLLDNSIKQDMSLKYRLNEYEYLNLLYKTVGTEIAKDNLSFSSKANISCENIAEVEILEEYLYYRSDQNEESFRRRKYYFTLEQKDANWIIKEIRTNDPWEQEDKFEYTDYDIEAAVKNALDQTKDTGVKDDIKENGELSKSLNQVTYSTSTAVNYAKAHYKDEDINTSIFPVTSENCQNFASQCVWAGLGAFGSSTSNEPAVSIATVGYTNSPHIWCQGEASTHYTNYKLNWAWDNINGFMALMDASVSTFKGPYGNSHYSNGVTRANVGNVLGIDTDGLLYPGQMDHAMFVTQVTGTYGSRSMDQVKIAAHNSETSSAFQTLASYYAGKPYDNDNFGRAEIFRGYY